MGLGRRSRLRPHAIRSLCLTLIVGTAASFLGCGTGEPARPGPGGEGGEGGAAEGGAGGRRPGSGGAGGAIQPGTGGGGASGSGGGTGPALGGAGGGGGGGGKSDGAAADGVAPDASAAGSGGAPADGGAAPGDAGPQMSGGPKKPSAGCGKAGPPTGARTFTTGGTSVPFIVSLPPGYNPATPYPLAFAFHGYMRNHQQCQSVDCPGFQSQLGPKAILVYQKSIGLGWEQAANRDKNVQAFQDLVALMKREYCVDENRVAAVGVSSGGQFVNILACRMGDQLWVTGPIAGIMLERTNCKGTPAALVIHGVSDNLVNGQSARDAYVGRNGCMKTTTPDLAAMHAKIAAARAAGRTEYACVDYQGCTANPVRWCEHSEPGYAGTTHGWPTFGGKLVADFLGTLK
jgi:poly(3-hydroxybutyrate) depolymerase